MTIEEVLEKMMKEYDAGTWGKWPTARVQHQNECRRVLELAAQLGIRFS